MHCEKFQNDWRNETVVMEERGFANFVNLRRVLGGCPIFTTYMFAYILRGCTTSLEACDKITRTIIIKGRMGICFTSVATS